MLVDFTVKTEGKGTILKTEVLPAPNNKEQNWWKLTIQNGPTDFELYIPTERNAVLTKQLKNKYAPGGVIHFISTPSKGKEVAQKIIGIDSHKQGQFDFEVKPEVRSAA
jgi:uncharacterized protein (DUF2126 family)